jgi:cytochrome c553
MTQNTLTAGLLALAFVALPESWGWRVVQAVATAAARESQGPDPALVERGAYIVRTSGCHDCHTPWTLGENGPEPDMSRALSGHPAELVMPPPPKLPEGPWVWMGSASNTAFAGPWGVSFAANLTPDPETGLGKWTVDTFMQTIRTQRHEGKGRPLLPPMTAPVYAQLTDQDLRSVFAYLQSVTPMKNRVPAPVDPPEAQR